MMTRLILGLMIVHFMGCSSMDQKGDSSNVQSLFQKAVELEEKGYYDKALQIFAQVRDQYPYSDYSIKAKLKIADIYFEQRDYPSAQVFYEFFKNLHPRRQADYVLYRLALSYYHRLPRVIARDFSLATKSVDYFQELLMQHPQSEFAEDGRVKLRDLQEKLIQKQLYIADFYFKQKMYKSALLRYSQIIQNIQETTYIQDSSKKINRQAVTAQKAFHTGNKRALSEYVQKIYSHLLPKILLRGCISAAEVDDRILSRYYSNILKQSYPQSSESQKAQRVIQKYEL